MGQKKIIIIGAGVGGLVSAAELGHAGFDVTVLERAQGPGGKMRTLPSDAGPVDAGPTVFTMPWVFEQLFDALGTSLDAHLTLRPLDLLARHQWRGDPMLDLFADQVKSADAIGRFSGPAEARAFERYCARAARLYAAFRDPVMTAADPSPMSVARANLAHAPRLLADLAPLSSLARDLTRQFRDPRLRQLFGRYATYVGGSPFLSPAVLSLIWHVEASGVSCVMGGMAAVAQALEDLGRRQGVQFHYGADVSDIRVQSGQASGVALRSGETLDADAIIFNGDNAALAEGLLGQGAQSAGAPRKRTARSLSAWVWTFSGDPGPGAPLAHHNVYFSDDSRSEFDTLTRIRSTPLDPTLYLCAQDRHDGPATQNPERFQIIMNAPGDGDVVTPTEQEIRQCEMRVFSRLKEAGVDLPRPEAENALTTPWDFNTLFPGTGGAIYGASPHGMMATFRRPRARTALAGLYLAGGTVHPGPGVPMAALSGRLAAAAIISDLASTSASRRTAMPGGMSTGSPTTVCAASRSSPS